MFSVHYTKVTAAWVGSLLLRLARLFPKELDLRKTAKDVDELAGLLAQGTCPLTSRRSLRPS